MKINFLKTSFDKITLFLFLFCLSSCSSAYYSFWETFGTEKRDLLRTRVEDTRDQQIETSQKFADALSVLQATYGLNNGSNEQTPSLQQSYENLKSEYKTVQNEVEELKSRIEKMHNIATDLFKEWEEEGNNITNVQFRTQSLNQLSQAKFKYESMRQDLLVSQSKMDPIVFQLHDYVIFLKHNLNAQSLGALSNEASLIKSDIQSLINMMQQTIVKTDTFIQTL